MTSSNGLNILNTPLLAKMSTKPVVNISDCYVYSDSQGRERLAGVVFNYPEEHKVNYFKDGDAVITSPIVSKSANFVETVRTIYRITNWKQNETSKT